MIKPGTLCIATSYSLPNEFDDDNQLEYTTEIGWYMGLVVDDDPAYGCILMHYCTTQDRAITHSKHNIYCHDVRPVTPDDLIRWANSNPSTDFS